MTPQPSQPIRSVIRGPLIQFFHEPTNWQSETLFFDGDEFFGACLEAIASARKTIELETYIFAADETGLEFLRALMEAARRGVEVRVLVDGVGSAGWQTWADRLDPSSAMQRRVYKPLPYFLRMAWTMISGRYRATARMMSRMNRRDHRKILVVDESVLFIGSYNISNVHSFKRVGRFNWRDTGVRLNGGATAEVREAFESAWRKASGPTNNGDFLSRPPALMHLKRTYTYSGLLRLNYFSRLRRFYFKDLIQRMKSAQTRIWLTNPYFVPNRTLMGALQKAAERGVSVQLLLPRKNDVWLVRLASRALYGRLIEKGVRIYEYLPSTLHAKTMIIDNWMAVGSSNLNHRSLFHDLEVDACLCHDPTKNELAGQFASDLKDSEEILMSSWGRRGFWQRFMENLALMLRYWL